jgi:ATP-binding cassette subfamily B protein
VVVHGGQIRQDGAPDQLMRRDGPYRRLVLQEMGRLTRRAA